MMSGNSAPALSPKIRSRQGRTRQRILDVSARKFVQYGFENVSVEDIIEGAEIARSSFYRFFSNRAEVLTSVVRPVFERGVTELEAIDTSDPRTTMTGIFNTFLNLWQSNPDALRLSSRVSAVHVSLFEDVHLVFREKLAALLDAIEPTGIFLNGSADKTGRLMAGSIVSVMEIYDSDPDFEVLFHKSMQGFLLTVENNS
jgi:AcrR family transcriptional regulator